MNGSVPLLQQTPRNAKNYLQVEVLDFVFQNLAVWRDCSRKNETAEEALNGQMCKFLTDQTRMLNKPFFFHHEERQTGGRRVDFSSVPGSDLIDSKIYGYTSVCDDTITVFEAKRFPAPSKKREKEYVTGGNEVTGGIQRFKLGLHGGKHEVAAMIGYVQKGDCSKMITAINSWIEELDGKTEPNGIKWQRAEVLKAYIWEFWKEKRIAWSVSAHDRLPNAKLKPIRLHHLWVEMNQGSKM